MQKSGPFLHKRRRCLGVRFLSITPAYRHLPPTRVLQEALCSSTYTRLLASHPGLTTSFLVKRATYCHSNMCLTFQHANSARHLQSTTSTDPVSWTLNLPRCYYFALINVDHWSSCHFGNCLHLDQSGHHALLSHLQLTQNGRTLVPLYIEAVELQLGGVGNMEQQPGRRKLPNLHITQVKYIKNLKADVGDICHLTCCAIGSTGTTGPP